MRILGTILLLLFFASSEGQNIKLSQIKAFKSVSAYRVFGRGSGTGAPSFLTSLDSNWIPTLHSQGYYDGRYATTGWSLTGNSINPATAFLGTTSNNSLRFKTNGVQRMYIDSTGQILFTATNGGITTYSNSNNRWGIGVSSPIAALDVSGGLYSRNYIQSPVWRGENITTSGTVFDIGSAHLGSGVGATSNQFKIDPFYNWANSTNGTVNGFNIGPTTNSSSGQGMTVNYVNINPTLNYSGTVSSTVVRGFYYKPVVVSLTGVTHIALETTSGLIILRNLPTYTDNASALSALGVDVIYRNGDDIKITH